MDKVDVASDRWLEYRMQEANLEHWPEDLRQVFAAVGKAMDGKRLSPGSLSLIAGIPETIVSEHSVSISHESGKACGQRKGRYIIRIVGPRVDACWAFRSGQLEALARSAVPQEHYPTDGVDRRNEISSKQNPTT